MPRCVLCFKQLADRVFLQFGADDAKSSGDLCAAGSDIRFTRYIVEVNPLSVFALYDTLCSEHKAVSVRIFQCFQSFFDLFDRIFLRRFDTDAVKDFIRVVMSFMSVVMAAAAVIIVIMVVMMVMLMFMFMMMVMFIVVVVMVVMMFVFVIVVMAAAAFVIIIVIVMMMVFMVMVVIVMRVFLLFCQMMQRFFDRISLFHRCQNLLAV